MVRVVKLSTHVPSTTLSRKISMGIFTQYYITYACMEIQLPLSIVLTSSHVKTT
jgi:hypothetical protein